MCTAVREAPCVQEMSDRGVRRMRASAKSAVGVNPKADGKTSEKAALAVIAAKTPFPIASGAVPERITEKYTAAAARRRSGGNDTAVGRNTVINAAKTVQSRRKIIQSRQPSAVCALRIASKSTAQTNAAYAVRVMRLCGITRTVSARCSGENAVKAFLLWSETRLTMGLSIFEKRRYINERCVRSDTYEKSVRNKKTGLWNSF